LIFLNVIQELELYSILLNELKKIQLGRTELVFIGAKYNFLI